MQQPLDAWCPVLSLAPSLSQPQMPYKKKKKKNGNNKRLIRQQADTLSIHTENKIVA